MDSSRLKEYILENNFIPTILEQLGCHHIKYHSSKNYYSCGNPDGDNRTAIIVYENTYLGVIDYTRNILRDESGSKKNSDIFTLIEYFKKCSFFQAVKFTCDWIDLDYYHDFDGELPQSLKLTRMIFEMQKGGRQESNRPLAPIPERILSYYLPYVNDMFGKDGIDYQTQIQFEVGYDEQTNRITIPIRDELGTLVGVKGRLFKNKLDADENKYTYLEPCARSQILYGLNLTYSHIKAKRLCYITEAEKGCMQLWSAGVCNAVATGGKEISPVQIEKLTRLCTDLFFLFDKDVSKQEMEEISSKFIDGIVIYAAIDDKNILNEKESPTDNIEKFQRLIKECCYRLK